MFPIAPKHTTYTWGDGEGNIIIAKIHIFCGDNANDFLGQQIKSHKHWIV